MNNPTPNSTTPDAPADVILDERYLERLSALADGELDPEWLLPTLDFLVRTPAARSFYVEMRALSGVLEGTGLAEPSSKLDPSLWKAIEDSAASKGQESASLGYDVDHSVASPGDPQRGERSKLTGVQGAFRNPLWAIAAALFAAVVGLASFELWRERSVPPEPSEEVASVRPEVTVGGKAGVMNDQRFISLATEMLEADRRYRKEMLALMEAIEDEPIKEKSTSESTESASEESRFGESSGEADGRNRDAVEINLW